jgi:hypothetical protein
VTFWERSGPIFVGAELRCGGRASGIAAARNLAKEDYGEKELLDRRPFGESTSEKIGSLCRLCLKLSYPERQLA